MGNQQPSAHYAISIPLCVFEVEHKGEDWESLEKVRLPLCLNLSQCKLELGEYQEVVDLNSKLMNKHKGELLHSFTAEIDIDQECPILLLEVYFPVLSSPVHFCSNIPAWKFLVILRSLISWLRCA